VLVAGVVAGAAAGSAAWWAAWWLWLDHARNSEARAAMTLDGLKLVVLAVLAVVLIGLAFGLNDLNNDLHRCLP